MKLDKIKICTVCKRELPATTEFFSPNKTGIHGLYSICRKCKQPIDRERRKTRDKKKELEQKKEYYKNNRDRLNSLAKLHNHIRKIKVKQRTCTICNEEKKLQLASINHTYTENPKDYMWLCQSCHHLYDSSRGEKEDEISSVADQVSAQDFSKEIDHLDSKLPEPKFKCVNCGKEFESYHDGDGIQTGLCQKCHWDEYIGKLESEPEKDDKHLWDKGIRCGNCIHYFCDEFDGDQCDKDNDMMTIKCTDFKSWIDENQELIGKFVEKLKIVFNNHFTIEGINKFEKYKYAFQSLQEWFELIIKEYDARVKK